MDCFTTVTVAVLYRLYAVEEGGGGGGAVLPR